MDDSMYGAPPAADSELGDKPPDSGAVVTVAGSASPIKGAFPAFVMLLVGIVLGRLSSGSCPAPEDAATFPGPTGSSGAIPAAVARCPPTGATQTALVSLSASHMQNSRTSGNVYASLVGTTGSSDEVLISHGIEARVPYSVYLPVVADQLGVPTALNLRLQGNDGTVFIRRFSICSTRT